MSKFLPISVIKDKELSEVDYKNRTIQLQGKYSYIATYSMVLN